MMMLLMLKVLLEFLLTTFKCMNRVKNVRKGYLSNVLNHLCDIFYLVSPGSFTSSIFNSLMTATSFVWSWGSSNFSMLLDQRINRSLVHVQYALFLLKYLTVMLLLKIHKHWSKSRIVWNTTNTSFACSMNTERGRICFTNSKNYIKDKNCKTCFKYFQVKLNAIFHCK